MTGLVFGSDLGLHDSSLRTLNGHFSAGDSKLRQGGIGHHVNASTGNLVLTDFDEILVGRGLDISAERTYNSQGSWNDTDANGWRFGFERQLVSRSGTSLTLRRADGSEAQYTYAGGVYKNGNGDDEIGEFRKSGSNYIYINLKTGAKDTYNANGYLISAEDADGNKRTYHYSNNRLTEIQLSNGEKMAFEYAGSGSKLSRLKTYANGSWSTEVDYSYDSRGRLSQVKSYLNSDVFTTTYKYDGTTLRISEISQSDGSKVSFTYHSNGKVASVTDGAGHKMSYTYSGDYTQIKDNFSRTWTYYFDGSKRLIRALTPQLSSLNISARQQDTRYNYDSKGHLTQVHNATAGHNIAIYTYDGAGNRTSATDAEGNKTEWRYSGKQLLSETVYLKKTSNPATTRYVYDGEKHLRYVIDAEGRVKANYYNAVGTLSSVITYERAKYNVSGLSVSTQLSLSQMDSWHNSQNKALTNRTDYFYDARDQLTETRNYANVNSSGAGILDSNAIRTKFVYDEHGLLRQKIAVKNNQNHTTSYNYDGEGRVTNVTDGRGSSTTTVYSGNTVKVTNAEGKITTSSYDAAGKLVSVDVTDGAAHHLAKSYYNANGQLAMSQSATGQRTYYFYDEAGRQNAVVNHDGMVSETLYTNAGDVAQKRVYWNRVSTNGWFNGATVTKTHISQFRPSVNSTYDRTTLFSYNKTGQLVATTDAEQNAKSSGKVITHTEYDSAGNVIKKTRGNRTEYFIFDKTGKQVGQIDAAGYLTEKVYNARGELVKTIKYNSVTNSANRSSGDMSKIRPAANTEDHHSYIYYDGAGRIRATVNAAGELIEHLYDEHNNREWTYRYKTRISAAISENTSLNDLIRHAGGTGNRTALRKDFNQTGQVITKVDAQGYTTTFDYNKIGQLETTSTGGRTVVTSYNKFGSVTRVQQGTESTTTVYDSAGRKIQQVDGEGNKTLFYYDAMGRVTYTVNAMGEVTQNTYDNFGQIKETRNYYNQISVSGLTGGVVESAFTGRLNTSASDGRTHSINYNRLGQKISEQNGLNLKSNYTYNDFGELKQSDIWKTTGGLRNITDYTYTVRGERKDVTTYGMAWSTPDDSSLTDDSLIRHDYDAFGNLVGLVSGNRANVNQRQVRTLFDKAGRERFTLNEQGYVTEKRYNTAGQISDIIEYKTKFGGSWTTESSVSNWFKGHASSDDRVTKNTYFDNGRLKQVRDALGRTESYTYDAQGNKLSFTNKRGHTWNYTYNSANRLETETAPMVTFSTTNGSSKKLTARPITRFEYYRNGNLKKKIEGYNTPDQRETEYSYDKANRQTKISLPGYYSKSEGKTYFAPGVGRVRQVKTVTYNALGLAVAESNNMGSTSSTDWQNSYKVYDGTGRVRYEIDADGFATEYQYIAAANSHSSVKVVRYYNRFNLSGVSCDSIISEDMAKSRIKQDNQNDRTLTREFDRQGRVSRVVGDTIKVYDSEHGVKEVAQETQFTYNEFGQVVKERTRIDFDDWSEKYFFYNNQGKKSAQFDVLKIDSGAKVKGYLTTYDYNEFGQLTLETEFSTLIDWTASLVNAPVAQRGNYDRSTQYDYDALGRKTKVSRWDSSSYLFYSSGDLNGAVSKLVTETGYDELGNIVYETNAAGGRVDKQYDALGRLIKGQGVNHWVANGGSGFEGTSFGRHITDYSYSIHGDVVAQYDQDSSGKTGSFHTYYSLDARGQRVLVTNGDGIKTEYKYDANGKTLSEKVGINDTYSKWSGATSHRYSLTKTYRYDKRGNQIRTEINGLQNRSEYAHYNAFGELEHSGKNDSRIFSNTYDKAGNLIKKHQKNGDLLDMSYDLQGRVTYQLAAGGVGSSDDWKTYNTYNTFGFLVQQKLPSYESGSLQPTTNHTEIDRWGNVLKSVNALGGITIQEYNLNNQVVKETLPTVVAADIYGASRSSVKNVIKSYEYDKLGNLVRSTDGRLNSTLKMYDSAGLLAWEKNAIGAVTEYRYDNFGNKTYTKDALGGFIRTEYNKRGLVTREGEIELHPTTSPSYGYGSNAYGVGNNGVPISCSFCDGHIHKPYKYIGSGLTHTYVYDNAGRRIKDIVGLSETSSNTVYTKYDASGNVIAKRTMTGEATHYTYNKLNQKTGELFYGSGSGVYKSQSWSYDLFDNTTQHKDMAGRTTNYVLNAHKQVSRETKGDNVNSYVYWNNGALRSLTRSGNDGWTELAKNLAEWSGYSTSGRKTTSISGLSRQEVSSYQYDLMGHRTVEEHSSLRKFTRNYAGPTNQPRYGAAVIPTGSETFVYEYKRKTINKYNERGQLTEVTSPQQSYAPKVLQSATNKYGGSANYIPNTSGIKKLKFSYDEAGNRKIIHAEVYKSDTPSQLEIKDYYYTYDKANRVVMAEASNLNGGYQNGTRYFDYDKLDRRIREIRRDGGSYDHETYQYLHGSGLLTTTSRLNDTSSTSLSATTYKSNQRSYDDEGRLKYENKFAITQGEGGSRNASKGALIQQVSYEWDKHGRLSRQTTDDLTDIIRVSGKYGENKVFDHSRMKRSSEVIYDDKAYDPLGNLTKYVVNVYRKSNTSTQNVVDFTEVHTKSYLYGNSIQQQSSSMTTSRKHWRPNNTTSYFDAFGELMYVRGTNTRSEGHDRMLISNRDGQVLFRRDGKHIQDYYYAGGNVLGESGTLSETNFKSHIQGVSQMQRSAPGTYPVSDGDTLKGIAEKLWGNQSLWYLIADANSIEPTAQLKQGMSLTIPTVNSSVHNNESTFKPYNAADAVGKIDAEAFLPPPSANACATMVVTIVALVVAAVVTYYVGVQAGEGVYSTIMAAGVGAAAGNAAGQTVAIALGVQDGFDVGQVFKSGIRGALAGAVGYYAAEWAEGFEAYGSSIGKIAARSAMQAGGNYLTNTIVEGESNFSWKSLLANTAGSMAGHYAGKYALGDGTTIDQQFAKDVASSFAGGLTENAARNWMEIGGKRGFEDIAIDAFGNAIGNSVAGAHRQAADKAAIAQRKSFAGVGPIFDWRNKEVKYDMSGYTPIFDWRNKEVKYDMSGYTPIFDWRNKEVKYDMSDYTPIFDWQDKDVKYNMDGYTPIFNWRNKEEGISPYVELFTNIVPLSNHGLLTPRGPDSYYVSSDGVHHSVYNSGDVLRDHDAAISNLRDRLGLGLTEKFDMNDPRMLNASRNWNGMVDASQLQHVESIHVQIDKLKLGIYGFSVNPLAAGGQSAVNNFNIDPSPSRSGEPTYSKMDVFSLLIDGTNRALDSSRNNNLTEIKIYNTKNGGNLFEYVVHRSNNLDGKRVEISLEREKAIDNINFNRRAW
ncbi:RHS repeat protein [Vibrio vulnificus]|nr:RHS repeat protein [Vibrio vulnificus]ELI3521908.1 RHS repeat protein [Vibrio vulnificus]